MDSTLGRVADVMTPAPVFVSTSDTVAKAAAAFHAHRLPLVPVLEGGGLAGVLTAHDLLEQQPFRPVRDLMARGILPAAADMPLLQAHALLVSQRREVLPVFEAGRPVGYVALSAVLRALSQQTDALTGLPWAAAVRTWAADALAHGRELAMLFIDVNNFREVNRNFGYVVGDGVLRTIADLLRQCTDPMTDLLCRYGGDKFAVATTRTDGEARALAERIRRAVTVLAAQSEQVTVSVGYAGGRRHGERAPGHAAAAVDDLLGLASRAVALTKTGQAAAPRRAPAYAEAPARREARVQLLDVQLESQAGRPAARVRLRLGSREVDGVSPPTASTPEQAARFLVAEATLQALHGILGEADVYTLENVHNSLPAAYPLAVAVVSGPGKTGQETERYIGGATGNDLPRAVCKAVLDALNRPLAPRLGAMLAAEGRA